MFLDYNNNNKKGMNCLNGEFGTERNGGVVYGSEVGLVVGGAGEGIGVLVVEPIWGQRWVEERGFEAK